MATLTPIRMPKWGLSMQEGTILHWWKDEGAAIAQGEDLVDIETSKITNVFEAPEAGTLRRVVAAEGETLPVGALIGVLADADVSDAEVDTFVAEFSANFKPWEESGEGSGALTVSTVDVGSRSIRVGRAGAGEGPPIVLIHGFSGDINNWLFNIEPLAAKAPVIALDLPGHGGSSKTLREGSLRELADVVSGTLDALDVQRAHVVGHSLGGAVAARLAADAPQRIASLVLIAPAHLPGTRLSGDFLNGVVEAQRARDLRPFVEMLFTDPSLVTKDMLEDMMRYKRLDGVEEALGMLRDRLLSPAESESLIADLAKIPAATVIASPNDTIVGVPDEAALPAGFRVRWIEGAGHMPQLERAADVNAILMETLG